MINDETTEATLYVITRNGDVEAHDITIIPSKFFRSNEELIHEQALSLLVSNYDSNDVYTWEIR